MGFTTSAKNCSFALAIEDLSIKANRTNFTWNNNQASSEDIPISNFPYTIVWV